MQPQLSTHPTARHQAHECLVGQGQSRKNHLSPSPPTISCRNPTSTPPDPRPPTSEPTGIAARNKSRTSTRRSDRSRTDPGSSIRARSRLADLQHRRDCPAQSPDAKSRTLMEAREKAHVAFGQSGNVLLVLDRKS